MYPHFISMRKIFQPIFDMCAWFVREGKPERHNRNRKMDLGRLHVGDGWMGGWMNRLLVATNDALNVERIERML
jgi:hypothetical protein